MTSAAVTNFYKTTLKQYKMYQNEFGKAFNETMLSAKH